MGFIDELKWRGMLHDVMPGTEEQLNKEMTIGYIGFDPTSDSLGVGNLVQIMTLLHFQNSGHKPIALIGGATGMIGDPSFKNSERNLLDEEMLLHNLNGQRKQLEKFLNFNSGANSAEIVNNYDWFKDFSFLSFIRDVGKHISVNYMMAKDSVKSRLETGLSFTEFSYQLIQGYDFYHLYHQKGVKLQLGGSDQWGNIVTGTELLRRKSGVNDAFALTTPLIKKADGTKFGKTESGNIWLDPAKTSAYKFFQFWLNASDSDTANYIRIFTLKNKAEIEQLEQEHADNLHLRILQKALAEDITTRVHGFEAWKQAVEASQILFGNATTKALQSLDEITFLDLFEGVPQFYVDRVELANGLNIIDLLSEKSNIFPSKGECRKLIQAGGLALNKEKVIDVNHVVNLNHLINQKYLLIQKGKKNYYLLIIKG